MNRRDTIKLMGGAIAALALPGAALAVAPEKPLLPFTFPKEDPRWYIALEYDTTKSGALRIGLCPDYKIDRGTLCDLLSVAEHFEAQWYKLCGWERHWLPKHVNMGVHQAMHLMDCTKDEVLRSKLLERVVYKPESFSDKLPPILGLDFHILGQNDQYDTASGKSAAEYDPMKRHPVPWDKRDRVEIVYPTFFDHAAGWPKDIHPYKIL